MSDNVNSPDHYTAGGIETIDIIKAKLTPEEFAGYCKGNVIKYVTRANLKGGLEDLKKAGVYLDWLIESMEPDELDGVSVKVGVITPDGIKILDEL